MEIIDSGIEGWSKLDQNLEDILNWEDMLGADYKVEVFDHNQHDERETYRIFHKYYRGRTGQYPVEGSRS